jgi:hypothetical protein
LLRIITAAATASKKAAVVEVEAAEETGNRSTIFRTEGIEAQYLELHDINGVC